jgi:apolipoprotein N-acyltransferase
MPILTPEKIIGKKQSLFAIAAGPMVTLSLAPFNFWPLGIVAALLLALALQKSTPQQAAWRGWLFGFALFGSGTSWVYVSINVYGNAPVPLAIALTTLFSMGLALFFLLTCWAYRRFLSDTLFANTAGFATFWILCEWLRSWFLTGFPWLFLGHAHTDSPLTGLAPVTGVLGISFIIAFTGSLIAQIIVQKSDKHPPVETGISLQNITLICLALWLISWALQFIQWTEKNGAPIRIAMVQPATEQELKWNRSYYHKTLNTLIDMSAPLWSTADIVIWPEAAIPNYLDNAKNFVDEAAEKARLNNTSLITGIPSRSEPDENNPLGQSFNSVIAIGNGSGIYHKQNLVPFGEYVPLQDWLRGLIEFFDLPMSNFSRGPANQAPLQINIDSRDITLSPFLCYEIVYGDLVAKSRADILLTLSNDTWFGKSIGPDQHLQIARLRAIENGRELIRATNSGISVITDAHGNITAQLPQFSQQTLIGNVQPRTGLTPYAYVGSWPMLLAATILIIITRQRKITPALPTNPQ